MLCCACLLGLHPGSTLLGEVACSVRWRQSHALGKPSQNQHCRAMSSSQASSSASLAAMQAWNLAHEQESLGAAARAVTVAGRQYSCRRSPSSGAGPGGLGCCGEEEKEEEEQFTRWQPALRLPVGTWASEVVKGPGSGFAQESYGPGGPTLVVILGARA